MMGITIICNSVRRIRPSRRAYALMLIAGVALLMASGSLHANGWEHHAIPRHSLLLALKDTNPSLRERAAVSLGIRGEKWGVEPLLAVLAGGEKSRRVRQAIFTALGQINDPRAGPSLVRALESETREELRADAATALGALGLPSTLPRILAALKNDPSLQVRARLVDALGFFPQETSIAALVGFLKGGSSSLRIRAIRALGATRSRNAAGKLLNALKRSHNREEKAEIVSALGRIGDPASLAPLAEIMEEAESPQLRLKAIVAIAAIRHGVTTPTLVGLLRDSSPTVLYFAIDGLRENHARAAVGPIMKAFFRISRQFWAASRKSLLADPAPALAKLALQAEILRALIALDPPVALPAFLKSARLRRFSGDSAVGLKMIESVYELRRIAMVGLGYTKSAKAAEFLSSGGPLRDSDSRLRAAAVRSLGVLGKPGAFDTVVSMIDDSSAEVRREVALVLGRLRDRRAAKPLRVLLSDGNDLVREEAVTGLGYVGAKQARRIIAEISRKDPSRRVRDAARQSLTALHNHR